ncbi:MAG: hypothetical protein RBT80_19210 [Candidatus Vecturithrix sp.]|jgi:hypothetical protein|nr:hypothetical protein [Candidatus Vecturithrix sp.]
MRALDLFWIPGLPSSEDEVFEPLQLKIASSSTSSANGSNGIDLILPTPLPISITSITRPEFPLTIWNQQTQAIDDQTAYLQHVQSLFEEKKAHLPTQSSKSVIGSLISTILDELGEEALTVGLKLLLKVLSGISSWINPVIAFLMAVSFLWLKDLWDRYALGIQECEHLVRENDAVRDLSIQTVGEGNGDSEIDHEKAWEYFRLREQLLSRHAAHVHNLLTEIIALESQTHETLGGNPDEGLIQAVKDLRYNNLIVEGRDGRRILLTNGTFSEDA